MNCKPNDLAVVVRTAGSGKALGRIVRCVAWVDVRFYVTTNETGPVQKAWLIDPPLPGHFGRTATHAPDEWLRPIRDEDGEDEVLQMVGKPQPTHEVA